MQENLSEGRPVSWLAVPVNNFNKQFCQKCKRHRGKLPFLSYYLLPTRKISFFIFLSLLTSLQYLSADASTFFSHIILPSLHLSARSPALPQEQFEAVWTAIRNRQLQTVVAHSPDDGGGVHILIGHLSCQHLPQHDAE